MAAVVFAEMIGRVVREVSGFYPESAACKITFNDGSFATFEHRQDCCEVVEIVDVCGDPSDLVGWPLTVAEDVSQDTPEPEHSYCNDSHTWTFYRFEGPDGFITVRWLGESNGYYGEEVDYKFTEASE